MKVITLDKKDLIFQSTLLAQSILDSNWSADLIIGIKTGGIYVAQPLYEEIIKHYPSKYATVSLSRASTQKKKKIKIDKVLKRLPYFILDVMRKLEVTFFELTKAKIYNSNIEDKIILDKDLQKQLLSSKTVLLVDDAIDTGNTILAIKNKFLSINPQLDIKTAVLTTTHKISFIQADYSLYKRVLLRCPWAADYKGETYAD